MPNTHQRMVWWPQYLFGNTVNHEIQNRVNYCDRKSSVSTDKKLNQLLYPPI